MSNLFLTTTVQTGCTSAAETTRHRLAPVAGAASTLRNKNTSANPANPLKITDSATAGTDGNTIAWYSDPLAAVTIIGQIAVSLWCRESTTSANAAPTVGIYRCSGVGAELATIIDPALNGGMLEMVTTAGGATKTRTIAAASVPDTAIASGERLKVALFIDNAVDQGGSGTMAASLNCQYWVNGPTGSAGQSQISFTENLFAQQPGIVGDTMTLRKQAIQRSSRW